MSSSLSAMLASFDAQRLAAAVAKVHVVFLRATIVKPPRFTAGGIPVAVIVVVRPLACQRLPHNWLGRAPLCKDFINQAI